MDNISHDDYLRKVLVLGNGFDIDLRLKTRYSDFAKSDQWKKMYDENVEKSNHYSLLKYLNDKKEVDCWFDIEQALLDYSSIKTKGIFIHDIETDKHEYHLICNAIGDYLDSHLKTPKFINRDSIGLQLIDAVFRFDDMYSRLYTFNFTPIQKIANYCERCFTDNVQYVHGNNEKKSLILGINVSSLNEIIPEYSFLIKSNNSNYQSTNIEYDMMNAKEVIIFGHSLNMIDAVYFDDYLKFISTNNDKSKRLTIITYNNDSKVQILDNIRRMGVSVPKLYSHSHLEFILTENINRGVGSDKNYFDDLITRL